MTTNKEFPTTTMAERAAQVPGPKTVSALLEKVDFPNDYTHVPEFPDEVDTDYFWVSYAYECGPPMEAVHSPEFGDASFGGNAWRKRDPVPADPSYPHIMTFKEFKKRKNLADLYGWFGDFWLISDRLRTVIEDLDPGSLDCVRASQDGFTLDQSYWACLPKRNLEAVDTTRSHVWFEHNNYGEPGGDPVWTQTININRGAVFDPSVTQGAHHFWDIDLHRWFWSRELIARAHMAGVKGPRFLKAGKPVSSDLTPSELQQIYDDFAE